MNFTKTFKFGILIAFLAIQLDAFAQTRTISGVVCDEDEHPLPGVSVYVYKTNIATMTDPDGRFRIEISDAKQELVFSFFGMKTVQIEAKAISDTLFLESEYVDILEKTIHPDSATFWDRLFRSNKIQIQYIKKPNIYLYPKQAEIEISVKLDFDGKFSTTYPEYNNGWHVRAQPDGTLTNLADGSHHKYLFWEGIHSDPDVFEDLNSGFIVSKVGAPAFLDTTLTKLGLSEFEKNDFITFWLPRMRDFDHTFVHFIVGTDYDRIAKHNITPAPDQLIRVYMVMRPADVRETCTPQRIPTVNRLKSGFIAVEWGGTQIERKFFSEK